MTRLLAAVGCVVPLAAGCAQLVGIDDTNDTARAGNTVALTRLSIGATLVSSPLDLTGLHANYLVANAASASGFDRVAASDGGGGKWTSLLRTPTPVELTLPDVPTALRVFAFPSTSLSVPFAAFEHPGRTPPPDPATIAFSVPLDTAYVVSDRFQVYTLGSWTSRALAAGELTGLGTTQLGGSYMFASSTSISGRPELDRLTSQDVFLVLRYAGAALTGAAVAPPFDQTGNDSIMTNPMVTVAADQQLDVKVMPTALAMRYTGVRPAVSSLSMSWSLVAAPAYRFAFNTGPVLNSGSLAMADVGVSLKYGNPFVARQWNTIFTFATSETRVFTPQTPALPVTLYAGMQQYIEPSTTMTDTLKLEAGLPLAISIDGKPLSSDGQIIAPPTRFLAVTYIVDNPVNTLYNLEVYDLVPNMAGTALDYRFVFAAASKDAAFNVPPELFVAGHSYTMRARAVLGGYPAVGSGDFSNRELPLSQAFLDGAVITVMR